MSLAQHSDASLALLELAANREDYIRRFHAAAAFGSQCVRSHDPHCVVYRAAELLLGADRRGMCTCGAEQPLVPA